MNFQQITTLVRPTFANLLLITAGTLAVLALTTIAYFPRWRRDPTTNVAKIGARIRFLWELSAAFILATFFGRRILVAAIAFIAYLALKEYLSLTPTRRADRRVLFFAYLSITIQFVLIGFDWYEAFVLFVPVYVFLVLPLLMIATGDTDGFLKAWSLLGWGIITNVYSLGHLAFLVMLPRDESGATGFSLFLFLMILAQSNHVAQSFFGRWVRRPELSIRVSRTRNWASLFGSVGTTSLGAWLLAPLLTPFEGIEAALYGALVALGGFVGYVVLSAIKHDLELSDRGVMTAGHGGMLNRIDIIVYTAPLFFQVVRYVHYQ